MRDGQDTHDDIRAITAAIGAIQAMVTRERRITANRRITAAIPMLIAGQFAPARKHPIARRITPRDTTGQ